MILSSMTSFLRFLAAISITLISAMANAAEITDLQLDDGTHAILITGNIEEGDNKKFGNIAATLPDAIVALDSNGGNLLDAIEIGKSIRVKGFQTVVLSNSNCNSSCGLIWLAGSQRFLSERARIGLHASYTLRDGQTSESGVGNAIVGRYLTLLNLPEKFIIFATLASPQSANWITNDNASNYGLEVRRLSDEADDNDKSTNGNTEIGSSSVLAKEILKSETTLWKQSSGWTIFIDHSISDACYMAAQFPGGTIFRIGFTGTQDLSSYLMLLNKSWQSLDKAKNYKLEFKFDSDDPWTADATASTVSKTPGLSIIFSNEDFWKDIIRKNTLLVRFEDKQIEKLSLAGTDEAFVELAACEKVQRKNKIDPFAE